MPGCGCVYIGRILRSACPTSANQQDVETIRQKLGITHLVNVQSSAMCVFKVVLLLFLLGRLKILATLYLAWCHRNLWHDGTPYAAYMTAHDVLLT